MERQKIESQFKWTIDEMYTSESDLNKDIEKVKELVEASGAMVILTINDDTSLYTCLLYTSKWYFWQS